MRIIPTNISEVLIFEPVIHGDSRGYFLSISDKISLKNISPEQPLFRQMNPYPPLV